MTDSTPSRIAVLDLIRGVAVLGILAINIAGFAAPISASDTPALPFAPTHSDEISFAFAMVIFEGKMRALFSLLFGASMQLFVERADAAGRHGEALQMRRLAILAAVGWLHYILLWWGDILFVYAVCGFFALALRRMTTPGLVAAAALCLLGWSLWGALSGLPTTLAEEHLRLGIASPAERAQVAAGLGEIHQRLASDMAQMRLPFAAAAQAKLATAAAWPLIVAIYSFGETLPLMLLGMALYRSGFFAGVWPRRQMVRLAIWGLSLGGVMTLALLGWAMPRHFPPQAMPLLLTYWAGPAHVAMALGYAAVLALAAPGLLADEGLAGWLAERLVATGRMAFSNYLGTSLVMCAIFSGWGLGRVGHVGRTDQIAYVVLGWLLMLGWSKPWLERFHQGPLEWLWRSATEGRMMPMRRLS